MSNNDIRAGGENALDAKLRDLQTRLLTVCGVLPDTATDLREALVRILNRAARAEVLRTAPHDIPRIVTLERSTRFGARGRVFAIVGGPKDFRRLQTVPSGDGLKERILRDDGGVIHFSITVAENDSGLELIAYNFEVYRPAPESHWFVRFDLNERGHNNEGRGLRSHFHPADDDLHLPSPVMTPAELLALVLYGVRKAREHERH